MCKILSQSEVDALLNAVDNHVPFPEMEKPKIKNDDVIDVLLDALIERFIERYRNERKKG